MTTKERQSEHNFEKLTKLKPEHLEPIIKDAMKTFDFLRNKTESTDPKDLELAIEAFLDLKDSLATKLTEALTEVGLSQDELNELIKDPSQFTEEEKAFAKEIDDRFKQFTANLPQKLEKKPNPTNKKKKTAWIPG